MIPVPVAYENGYKLTPGSMSAVCCVIPTIVDEETGDIRLGMTYNEIYATMKQRPCFIMYEDVEGVRCLRVTAAVFDNTYKVYAYAMVNTAYELMFMSEEATDFPVFTAESEDDPH